MNKKVTFLQICTFKSKKNNKDYYVLEVLVFRETFSKYVLESYFISNELYLKFLADDDLETFEEIELIYSLNDNLKAYPSDYKKIY